MNLKDTHVLIDTCIFNNLQSKQADLAQKTSTLLQSLVKNNNKLYFSEFTRYELLRDATKSKAAKIENSLNSFIEVHTTPSRIKRAPLLYSGYKKIPIIKGILHSISDIDIFIGSLIFTEHRPLLLTSDYNDFPRPFFTEKSRKRIEFINKKNNLQSIYYYFLEADLESL